MLRDARPTDAAAMADLNVRAWRAAFVGLVPDAFLDGQRAESRVRYWEEHLPSAPPERTWVAERGGRVIGLTHLGPSRDPDAPDAAEMYGMYVEPEAVGTGAGKALMAAAMEWFRAGALGRGDPVDPARRPSGGPLLPGLGLGAGWGSQDGAHPPGRPRRGPLPHPAPRLTPGRTCPLGRPAGEHGGRWRSISPSSGRCASPTARRSRCLPWCAGWWPATPASSPSTGPTPTWWAGAGWR